MGRQSCEKLLCLYENIKNRKTAVLKKSYTAKDSTDKFCGPYPCLNFSSRLR